MEESSSFSGRKIIVRGDSRDKNHYFVSRRVEAWGAPMSAERSASAPHCRTRMAKVVWSAGIDHVSGALSKPSKDGQHSCEKMLLATHRTAATTSKDCNRLFLREKVKRSTPVSAEETAARQLFSRIAKAVALRRKNVEQMVQDQQAFQAQKDSPNGYKTIYSYLWHVVADSLNG